MSTNCVLVYYNDASIGGAINILIIVNWFGFLDNFCAFTSKCLCSGLVCDYYQKDCEKQTVLFVEISMARSVIRVCLQSVKAFTDCFLSFSLAFFFFNSGYSVDNWSVEASFSAFSFFFIFSLCFSFSVPNISKAYFCIAQGFPKSDLD